ncbi:hypothetical protein D6D03_05476 [Aureobasidium pullulans]|nr:hypothetical protein D6D03_05476 [Aureobasidium pullulans]
MPQPKKDGANAVDHDHVSKSFTLKGLNDSGYINADLSQLDLDYTDFAQDTKANGKVRAGGILRKSKRDDLTTWARKDKGEYDDPDSKLLEEAQIWVEDGEVWYIHPVLQRDHWNHMSNDDWNSIRPSIELASRILDMVEILPFFYGLIAGSVYDLKDSAHNQAHNIIFQEWEMKEVPTVLRAVGQEAESVFLYMVGLRGSVQWEFSHIALSDRRFAQTGWLSKSKKALVEINEDFLDILSGRQQVHDYSMSWEPGTDVESARLRTQVALAITIVHEFAHAIWFCINKKYKVDPYLRGHFINELGFELEHMLFSGLIMPIGTPAVEAAPYGFKIDRFPEAGIRDDEETRVFSREPPSDSGSKTGWSHPVSMKWVSSLFTVDKWEEVARLGLSALEPPRKTGFSHDYRIRKKKRPRSPSATSPSKKVKI